MNTSQQCSNFHIYKIQQGHLPRCHFVFIRKSTILSIHRDISVSINEIIDNVANKPIDQV